MNCFPCFTSQKKREKKDSEGHAQDNANQAKDGNAGIQTFTFRELASATRNFRQECLLGEGGFGRVYKGTLQETGQVVAVKQLDRNAMEGNKEFLVEVQQLSLLQHPNLVNLLGYCADGDQRLLVYEFMPKGSIQNHLYDLKPEQGPLTWITRMKIAYGAAEALEYLHVQNNPPVIYRDFKSSNVLLDEDYKPKLSNIGLSKLGHSNDMTQSRVMGTYGYSAPEYSRTGNLTTTADVYSFGVVLLELITGRRAVDTTKPVAEQNLVTWAQPIFKDPKKFPEMADPALKKRFPERSLNQVVAIAAMCCQDEPAARPLMSDVVAALSFLSMATEEINVPPTLPPSLSSRLHCISNKLPSIENGEDDQKKKGGGSSSSSRSSDDDDDANFASSRVESINSRELEDEPLSLDDISSKNSTIDDDDSVYHNSDGNSDGSVIRRGQRKHKKGNFGKESNNSSHPKDANR